jgi:hypothetical protein
VLNGNGDLLQVHVQSQFDGKLSVAMSLILCWGVHVMHGLIFNDLTQKRVPVLRVFVNPAWQAAFVLHTNDTTK